MDWRGIAEQELALIKPETRTALEQYAEGVNAYLADRDPSDISVAYTVLNAGGLGYRPEPWTAVDSLAWLKAMAWDLRGNMDEEISRALSLASVGTGAHRRPLPGLRLRRPPADRVAGRGRRRGLRAGRDGRRHPGAEARRLGRRRRAADAAALGAGRDAGVPRPR